MLMPKKTPQHERLSYLVSKSPGIKILENVAFHSMYYFTTAFTLSCCISKIRVFENHAPFSRISKYDDFEPIWDTLSCCGGFWAQGRCTP